MKILLVQNAVYLPAHGGAPKANRRLIEDLAERGHTCLIVAPASSNPDARAQQRFLDELAIRRIPTTFVSSRVVVFQLKGVEVHAVVDISQLSVHLAMQIREFEPTVVLVASEGPAPGLLQAALQFRRPNIVALIQTTLSLPFGPYGAVNDPLTTDLLSQAAGIIVISRYLQAYIQQWSGLSSNVLPLPVYGAGPFPYYGRFDGGYITMINPCGYKGITIFLELAKYFPHAQFAAVPTWGTTQADRTALEQVPNIVLLQAVDDIDRILHQTRILLVPSLWEEAFGNIVVEAMLRGIPVLTSDVGGLPEAKLGVDYVLPVERIERYEQRLDDRHLPIPIIPQQDILPWSQALNRLLTDHAHYEDCSNASREAATAFVRTVSVDPIEQFLAKLQL